MTRSILSFKRFALATTLAGLAATAMAQTPPAAPPATDAPARHAQEHERGAREQRQHRHDPAKMQAQREQRQAKLKEQLKITAAQEPAWHAFTASMLPPAQRPAHPDREALRSMKTPERIEHMRAMQAERATDMNRRSDAVLRLYAALTPEQQQVFDQRAHAQRGDGPHHPHQPHHRDAPPKPAPKG